MNPEQARERVSQEFPDFKIRNIEYLGEGMSNRAFRVNGEYIFRFSKDSRKGHNPLERECRILDFVKDISPLPVPCPEFRAANFIGYRMLSGRLLLEAKKDFLGYDELPKILGDFFAKIHQVPVADALALGVQEDNESLSQWLIDAGRSFDEAHGRIPGELHRPIKAFLKKDVPGHAWQPVFSHNDLGIEHIIVEDDRVTGVIDWDDAAICDPAYDFGRLNRDLGDDFVKAVLGSYQNEAEDAEKMLERSRFYAVCTALEDLSVSLPDGKNELYWQNSLEALKRVLVY